MLFTTSTSTGKMFSLVVHFNFSDRTIDRKWGSLKLKPFYKHLSLPPHIWAGSPWVDWCCPTVDHGHWGQLTLAGTEREATNIMQERQSTGIIHCIRMGGGQACPCVFIPLINFWGLQKNWGCFQGGMGISWQKKETRWKTVANRTQYSKCGLTIDLYRA